MIEIFIDNDMFEAVNIFLQMGGYNNFMNSVIVTIFVRLCFLGLINLVSSNNVVSFDRIG